VDEQIYDMIGTSTLTIVTTCRAVEDPQELNPDCRPRSDQTLMVFRAPVSASPPSPSHSYRQGWFQPTHFQLVFKGAQDKFTSNLSWGGCRREKSDMGDYTRTEFHFYNPQDKLERVFLSVYYRDEGKNGKFRLEAADIIVARIRDWLSQGHREVEQ